jgi:hypothetical protein
MHDGAASGHMLWAAELRLKSGFEQVRFFRWVVCLNLDETPFELSLRRGGSCLCGGGEMGTGGMI